MSRSESHFSQPLLKTPFHERARVLSQVDRFIPWAGYTTVDVFTTMEQEYFAIRNAATLYDLTPMVKYRIAGPDALAYLNRLVTRDLGKLKPDRVAYCVWCNDAGHVLDALLSKVLELSNIEAGHTALSDEAFDLEALIELSAAGPAGEAARKGLAFAVDLDPLAGGHWRGDAAKIRSVLLALLSNAVKYSYSGKQIWVEVRGDDGAAVCSVRDEGPGLSQDDQARLFQRGVRLTPRPTAGEVSTGYGLAVAKDLIDRLGGKIWCDLHSKLDHLGQHLYKGDLATGLTVQGRM